MKKPDRTGTRINLTIPPDVIETLDRIVAAVGSGRASVIREFLIEAHPGLVEMAHALELAKNQQAEAYTVLARAMETASENAHQLSLDIKRSGRAMRRKRGRPTT